MEKNPDAFTFEDIKYDVQACGRIILEVIEDDIGVKNYIWVERIIPNFSHFCCSTYQEEANVIVSVDDKFLLDLQKKIYSFSNFTRTITNLQGGRTKKNGCVSYTLSDIEYTDTIPFFEDEDLLELWCKLNNIEPQQPCIQDDTPLDVAYLWA